MPKSKILADSHTQRQRLRTARVASRSNSGSRKNARRPFTITFSALAALCTVYVDSSYAALTCLPNSQTVNFGSYNAGPSITTSQQSSCNGGTPSDTIIQCTRFVSNSNGSSPTSGTFYMDSGSNQLGFLIRKYAGSNISTGVWYTQTATLNTSGSATVSELFTALPPTGQSPPSGTYTSTFTVEVKIGSLSTVGSDCSGVGVYDSTVPWNFSAYVDPGCTVSGGTLNFGSVGTLSTSVAASTTITPVCTSGLTYTIALNGGQNGGTTATNRRMASGANYVTYGLFTDSAHTQGWYGASVSKTGTGSAQAVSVYGSVPAQSTPSPGTYSDTVVITVSY